MLATRLNLSNLIKSNNYRIAPASLYSLIVTHVFDERLIALNVHVGQLSA